MEINKILINIENLIDIEKYKKIGINNFLFAVNKYSVGYNSFDIDQIINLDCKKYLLLNKIMNNNDIELLKNDIDKLIKFDGIIFEDIGVFNVLKYYDIKLIWNQSHFATNYSSINYWLDNIYSAVISNEITSGELNTILNNVKKPVIVNVFGKNMIMYSRRTLLSNFNKYFNINYKGNIILKEKISDSNFLVKEDNLGTYIFNNTFFNYINYVKNNNVLLYLIYPFGLSVDEINKIINNNSNISYNDGFMNKKTIYKLGDINE